MSSSSLVTKPIPFDAGLPLIGNTVDFMKNTRDFVERMEQKHGSVIKTSAMGQELIILLGPEANQFVLQDRAGNFSSKDGWEPFIGRVFPGAIMSMDNPEHRFQRRIMQTAFKKPALTAYIQAMNPKIETGITKWKPQSQFLVFNHIKQLTLDLATGIFMGEKLGPEADRLNKAFIDTVEASLAYIRYPIPPFKMWRGVKARQVLVDYFKQLLPEKRKHDTPDFFSQFCHATDEDGARFSEEEVVNHMIFLMMAAHDTTTSTLSTVFYALAKNPEWQERLRTSSLKMGKKHLEFDDLEALEEIDWVMRESLRQYPPLTSMPRMVAQDCEFDGYHLKKGILVGIYPIHTHHMPAYWRNPEKFDPERFSPQRNEQKQHMFQWIPFGGGAHMCLGQHFANLQVKAILHHVLQRYRWEVAADYTMPYQLVPIARPKDGLPVKLFAL